MTKPDLPLLFAGAPPSAQRLFTDRVGEQNAFDASLLALKAYVSGVEGVRPDVQSLSEPRRNLLHFYGGGGVGKTTLLSKLAKRASGDSADTPHWGVPLKGRIFPLYYDLATSTDPTIDGLLIAMRHGFARSGLEFTAFDLLLARYWKANHPSEDLTAFLKRKSRVLAFSERFGFKSQFDDLVGKIAADAANVGFSFSGGAIVKFAGATAMAARRGVLTQHALTHCARLRELSEAPPTPASAPYYASALAWDLSSWKGSAEQAPIPIVFLDQLEEVSASWLLMLQHVVWLLPNVLFVTAGRNRLRWGDAGDEGAFRSGPACWPGLVPEATHEPRQHLIGPLDHTDSLTFLRAALGAVPTTQDLNEVATACGGLPYHLDLVVQHWRTKALKGKVSVSDVLVPFPELAARVLRDLGGDERRALFAASLFDVFSESIIARVANVTHGVVRGLTAKPILQPRQDAVFPWGLDRTIRQTLVAQEHAHYESWSDQDWRDLALGALREIRGQLAERPDLGSFWLRQAFQIAITFDLREEWLVTAVEQVLSRASWDASWSAQSLRSLPTHESWLVTLRDCCEIIFSRQQVGRSQVRNRLRALLQGKVGTQLDIAWYFLAEAERDTGDLAAAVNSLRRIASANEALRSRATHASIHILRRAGRFREVEAAIVAHSSTLLCAGRLRGDLLWTQARWSDSMHAYQLGAEQARGRRDFGEQDLCFSSYAFTGALVASQDAGEIVRRLGPNAPSGFMSFQYGLQLIASSLMGDFNDSEEGETSWAETRCSIERFEHGSLVVYSDLAEVLFHKTEERSSGWQSAMARLEVSSAAASMPYALSIAHAMVDHRVSATDFQWLDPDVLKRWSGLPRLRRAARG